MWHKQSFTQFWSQSDAYSRRSSLKLTYIHHPLVVCTHQICCAVAVPIALSQDRLLHGHNRLVNWTPRSRMREQANKIEQFIFLKKETTKTLQKKENILKNCQKKPVIPYTIITDFTLIYNFILCLIGSENGLSPIQCQAIIWTIAGLLLIGTLGTNFSESSIKIQKFSLKKIHFKMSANWRPFCLGLNVLRLIVLHLTSISKQWNECTQDLSDIFCKMPENMAWH